MQTCWNILALALCAGFVAVGVFTISRPDRAHRFTVTLSERGAWPLLDMHVVRSDAFKRYLIIGGVLTAVSGILAGLLILLLIFRS